MATHNDNNPVDNANAPVGNVGDKIDAPKDNDIKDTNKNEIDYAKYR